MIESPASEEALPASRRTLGQRPLHGRQRVVGRLGNVGESADVESARAFVLKRGERRVLAKDVDRSGVGEGVRVAEAARDLGHLPPVGPGFAGRRPEGPLTRDAPFRIRHGSVLLAPGGGRQRHGRRVEQAVDVRADLGHDEKVELVERGAHGVGTRQTGGRIGAHDPQRLDRAALDRLEHVDSLAPLARRHIGRAPEAPHAVDFIRRKAHMRRKLIGEPAHLAAAHRIGLSGQRKWAAAHFADAAGREMNVENRVDLVGSLRRLIDALAEAGDDALRADPQSDEGADVALRQSAARGDRRAIGRDLARSRKRHVEVRRCARDESAVQSVALGDLHEKAREEHGVHAGRDRQRCRSAASAVAVRRGSMTTMRAPRRAFACSMR